jgi:anti-sigma factor RsiW
VSVSRELLMRYHDGEVSKAEAQLVEEALDQEPALLDELEAYSELGSFVRAWADLRSGRQLDIADSVMRAIEPSAERAHPLLPRLVTWVSVGVAIAAGSVLVVRSWTAPPVAPAGAHANGASESASLSSSSRTPPQASGAAEADVKPPPATIESVDFGKNSGRIFVVSTDSSDTPVVWMPDDGEPDEDNEDRSESL